MIQTEIALPLDYTEADVGRALFAQLPLDGEKVENITYLRRTLKGSREEGHRFSLRLAFSVSFEKESGLLKMKKKSIALRAAVASYSENQRTQAPDRGGDGARGSLCRPCACRGGCKADPP